MTFDPWVGVTVRVDGVVAAQWDNFRDIQSIDTIYLGNRAGVVTWQFDNVTVFVSTPVCGDYGYPEMDLNSDCRVNLLDFAELAKVWLQPADITDLSELSAHWLECVPPVCMP
jgi:hypothetical protein